MDTNGRGRSIRPLFIIIIIIMVLVGGYLILTFNRLAPPPNSEKPVSPLEMADPDGIDVPRIMDPALWPEEEREAGPESDGFTPGRLRIALGRSALWAPLVLAGSCAERPCIRTAAGDPVQLDFIIEDDPAVRIEAFRSGRVEATVASLAMLPLFFDDGPTPSAASVRVLALTALGDGDRALIMRRQAAADPALPRVSDLRGRSVVMGQASGGLTFFLHTLLAAGLTPGEVDVVYARTPEEALLAFAEDPSIAAVLGHAPSIFQLACDPELYLAAVSDRADHPGPGLLLVRADLAAGHPEMLDALAESVAAARRRIADGSALFLTAGLLARQFEWPETEALAALNTTRPVDVEGEREFFLHTNHPAGFAALWREAETANRIMGLSTTHIDFRLLLDRVRMADLAASTSGPEFSPPRHRPFLITDTLIDGQERAALSAGIYFPTETATLSPQTGAGVYDPLAEGILARAGRLAADNEESGILVRGYSERPRPGGPGIAAARRLGLLRAGAVASTLARTADPDLTSRIKLDAALSQGDTGSRALGRRVEIHIIPGWVPGQTGEARPPAHLE